MRFLIILSIAILTSCNTSHKQEDMSIKTDIDGLSKLMNISTKTVEAVKWTSKKMGNGNSDIGPSDYQTHALINFINKEEREKVLKKTKTRVTLKKSLLEQLLSENQLNNLTFKAEKYRPEEVFIAPALEKIYIKILYAIPLEETYLLVLMQSK